MTCKSCAERRKAMKEWIASRLGIQWIDANPPSNIYTETTESAEAHKAEREPASKTRTTYRKQGVDGDTGTGTDT